MAFRKATGIVLLACSVIGLHSNLSLSPVLDAFIGATADAVNQLDAATLEAFGCLGDNGDGDGDGDDDPMGCVSRIARDRSDRMRGQRIRRDEIAAAARNRAAEWRENGDPRLVSPDATKFRIHGEAEPRFLPKAEWRRNATATGLAYPNVEIVGLPKTGTSHLYSILTSRPDTVAFNLKSKEFCSNKKTPQKLHRWHDRVFQENLEREDMKRKMWLPKPTVSVNGCIEFSDVIRRHRYLWEGKPGKQKVVVLFRDPADWMWASWNFWKDPRIDTSDESTGMWTDRDTDYRSPELFHEMWLGGPEKSKLFALRQVQFRNLSVEGVNQLRMTVGRENVLMLRSEDMRPDIADAKGGLLDKLSAFTGLARSKYSDELVGTYSNCNDNKGTGAKARESCESSASSAYGITGNRTMLPETRELIYMYFWEECKVWSEEFGVSYPDCLNVLPRGEASDRTWKKAKTKTQ